MPTGKSTRHKITRIIGYPVAGFYDTETGEIAINIQKIWEKYPDEDTFIENFSMVLQHEILHRVLALLKAYKRTESTVLGEERVLYAMQGRRFPKKKYEDYYYGRN